MSKISIINNLYLDKDKWNNCVEKAVNTNIYAFTWYLDIVSKNWEGLIYGDYELVFPIIFQKPFFFKKIYHPLFCQQLGPFASNTKLLHNEDVVLSILQFLVLRYKKFTFSINHHVSNLFKKIIQDNKLMINYLDRVNLELDLSLTHNRIISSYSTNHKRTLKLNYSNLKWDIETKINTDYINEFLASYKQYVGFKANLTANSHATIQSIIHYALKQNIGFLIGIRDKECQLLGAAFFIVSRNRDILLFNFSAKILNFNIMTIIIDQYIKMNVKKNKVLDFEGSNIQSLKRFYKGFGAVEKNYTHIYK